MKIPKLSILVPILGILTGCASVMEKAEPYFDTKVVWQNDRGSDWMIRSARPWVNDGPWKLEMGVGIEWDKGLDCPFIQVSQFQSLNWTHVGCAKRFGGKPKNKGALFMQLDLRHQVDSVTSWWLRTDHPDLRKQTPQDSSSSHIMRYNAAYHDDGVKWTGANPFYHLRVGVEWKRVLEHDGHKLFRIRCPVIATGRSLTQGWPYESEHNGRQADLYWSQAECNFRFGGK